VLFIGLVASLKCDLACEFEGKTWMQWALDVQDFDSEIATPVTLLRAETHLRATLKHAKNQAAIR
jgi:hypothetical protein